MRFGKASNTLKGFCKRTQAMASHRESTL
uniref:Uncharacterized protein n=1 Tax=Anguilla anguilla TaxID=7936 RepID=A0A0E9UZF8_ANGAN